MSTYRIEIRTNSGFDLHSTTTSRKEAMARSKDLAACGYDGRVITEKGHVSQEWKVLR